MIFAYREPKKSGAASPSGVGAVAGEPADPRHRELRAKPVGQNGAAGLRCVRAEELAAVVPRIVCRRGVLEHDAPAVFGPPAPHRGAAAQGAALIKQHDRRRQDAHEVRHGFVV